MSERKGRGGRPREGVHVKKSPMNMRTDPELREAVRSYAVARGLSMTQAAERLVRIGLQADAA